MVRSFLLTLTLLLMGAAVVSAQTTLTGKVKDRETGESLLGATVKVMKGANVIRGTVTNYDGEFRIQIDAGTYDVEFTYTGYQSEKIASVSVLTGQINYLDATLSSGVVTQEVVIKAFKVALIEKDKTSGGQTLTAENIRNLPTRNVNAIVATTAGTTSIDGGDVNIKGSRGNATNYYVDGIRVSGSTVPAQDIEQLQVITGGLGAEYGDVTGGVVSIVTKGPASKFAGGVDIENSHGLDPFGYLLATANLSGPIIKKKGGGTVVGFRLSGQYLSQKDDDPIATPVYHVKEGVRQRLYDHPLTRINGNVVSSAENITLDSVDRYNYRPFEDRQTVDLTTKLDFRLTSNIDFSVTGTYRNVENMRTPTGNGGWGDNNWLLLNAENNPTDYDQRWRTIARFRHRLGSDAGGKDAASANRVTISNASYQLQVGFERANTKRYDPRHQDRLFDYGYIGRFNSVWEPTFGLVIDSTGPTFQHNDFGRRFTGYQAGYEQNGQVIVPNQGLANYNEFANPESEASYVAQNGLFRSVYNGVWSDMHRNISAVSNRFSKSEDDIFTINASSSFDLRLGNTGTHNIQFGLLNEQRTARDYVVAPFGLWNLADQKINRHFNGIDYSTVVDSFTFPNGFQLPIYDKLIVDLEDQTFYKKVREANGLSLKDYVNVHGLRPDQLSLDMFSSLELTNQQLVNYTGYDYLGNKTAKGVTFNDFFTEQKDGVRTFPVAPQQPLYQAAFLKDKFTFKDVIFSLGVRVEHFDLNTKVMKDPYSLYEVMSADEYYRTVREAGTRPDGIGDDFKVYVKSKSNLQAKAFRDGDTWYDAEGTQQNDGNLIFGTGPVEALYRDTIAGDDIADRRFDPNTAFKDYQPQVNWLPRLAFSFPISDNANFFAHYDVLVQRPPSNWEVTPLDYLYFFVKDRTPENNANLKPERVVDYEVGFQQKLNNFSALKFSAYYREMRDMLNLRTYTYVPTLGRYTTQGNIDFGTTKGFTLQYDLRRIQNTEIRLAYTLQFADGTGSDAQSQRGILARGNLRNLFPLNFDERHNIAAILDYRFADGKQYSGPQINGKDILANFGVNFQVTAASGRPYTAKQIPTRFGASSSVGTINGNRLPWRTNVDMRVDKSFSLSKAGSKNQLNLNVYFRVSNLLNRKNVVSVYEYTGSPTNDGYLASALGQSSVQTVGQQGKNVQAYLNSYAWGMLNPNNFTQPRRMYVGAIFEF